MTSFSTTNPTTGQIIQTYSTLSKVELEAKISLSQQTFMSWSKSSFPDRSKLLTKIADILTDKRLELAELMTIEMGKRKAEGLAEIDKCVLLCKYYAKEAESQLSDQMVQTEASKSYIKFMPLGVVFAIMPWNFPFWQVFRAACPAIMAGNTMLLKHASSVPACALAIERIFKQAGAKKGLFQTLLISGPESETVIASPFVRLVSLTGSEEAGMKVASLAGKHIKRTVLELGGSDPFIVMPDADIQQAATTAATSRMIVTGQSCIAAKRFIVHKDIKDKFVKLFKSALESKKMGNPADDSTDVGPLSSAFIRDTIHDQVTRSLKQGAKLITGGYIPESKGFFYPPTILSDVTSNMIVSTEETFGPVAAVITVNSKEEALKVANNSHFGLGSSVWSNDDSTIVYFTDNLEAGCVFVNSMVKSDPRLPFGGTKFSGYGRELSEYGIKEFVNIKTIWLN